MAKVGKMGLLWQALANSWWVVALALAGPGACSGSGSGNGQGVDGGTGGARTDGSACGTPICSPSTCGIYSDPCGNLVNCGMCSFATTTGSIQASDISAAVTPDAQIEVAYAPSGGGVSIAHFANGAWTDEIALAASVVSFPGYLHLAVAADGTRWLSFVASYTDLVVAHAPEGGTWSNDGTVATTSNGALAVGSDGIPWVIYTVTGSPSGIFVGQLAGTTWTAEKVVAGASASNQVAIAMAGTQPMVAYTGNSGTLIFAQRDATGWTTSTLSSNAYGAAALAVAVSAGSDPAVVMAGDNLEVYRRTGTTWSTGTIVNPNAQSAAVVFDGNDNLWFAASGIETYLGNLLPGATPIQRIHRRCSATGVGLVPVGIAGLEIVDDCHGQLEAHVRQGPESADYVALCGEITATLCTQACTCTGVANCCYFPGSANWCTGTEAGCDHDMTLHMCGDVEVDVATLSTCRDALPQTTCTTQSNEQGAMLPAACAALY